MKTLTEDAENIVADDLLTLERLDVARNQAMKASSWQAAKQSVIDTRVASLFHANCEHGLLAHTE